jgi:hypothetical protein
VLVVIFRATILTTSAAQAQGMSVHPSSILR